MIDDGEPITLPAVPRAARPLHLTRRLTVILALFLVTMMGAFVILGYSVYEVSRDRNGWRQVARSAQQQVVDQGNEIACRSRANFETVKRQAQVIEVISRLVDAAGDQAKVAEIRPELAPAIDELDAALAAQDAAIPPTTDATSACDAPAKGTP